MSAAEDVGGVIEVEVLDRGAVRVFARRSRAGDQNWRLMPVDGVELEVWRRDRELLPPYLLPVDLVGGEEAFRDALARSMEARA